MRIAIIGAGKVGLALGKGWLSKQHEVVFGARRANTSGLPAPAAPLPGARFVSVPEAASFAEVIVLAVPWDAAEAAIKDLGDLRGKVLLDSTNPVKSWPDLDHGSGKSGGEQVAAWAPGAHVVKIFNMTGFENMADPVYPGGNLTMLYAGDDKDAKKIAHQLAEDLGFEAQDAGALHQSYLLEQLASLWGSLAYGQRLGRGIGFRLLRR